MVQGDRAPTDSKRRSTPGPLSEPHRRLVHQCRWIAENNLSPLLTGMFERLDDALFERADQAEAGDRQSDYLLQMRELRRHQPQVERNFRDGILAHYDRFWSGGFRQAQARQTAASDLDEDSLTLVDEADLEESLAVTNMVSKGENLFYKDLFALGRRFGALLGLAEDELEEKSVPLAPAIICQQFRDAMEALPGGDINARIYIYKIFEREVLAYVGGIYDEINARLVEAGVLPKLPHKLNTNPVAPSVKRARGETVEDAADKDAAQTVTAEDAGGGAAEAAEVFQGLRELARMKQDATGRPQGPSDLPPAEPQRLFHALTEIQREAPDLEALEGDPQAIKAYLLEQHRIGQGEGAQQSIGQSDEDTIDVISMLFEFILEDRAVPDPMKALIGRLQIPMVKVAILDRRFFSKKTHPARRLLNALAQAAVSWTDDGNRTPDSLYGRVESIVNRVLSEFTQDVAIFDALYEDFTAWQENEAKKAEVSEVRATQTSQGKERLELAKIQVAEEIAARMEGREQIPDPVRILLEQGWRDVLRLIYLRSGPEHADWAKALEVVDRLLWSVEPKSGNEDRKALLTAIPKLLKDLREGLEGIAYDQHKMTRLFKELRTAHIACLRNEKPRNLVTFKPRQAAVNQAGDEAGGARSAKPEAPAQAETPAQGTPKAPPEDEYTAQAGGMAVGEWLESGAPGSSGTRLKLAWRSAVTDNLVFVDRQGIKRAEMTTGELAERLRTRQARLIPDVHLSLMERALGAMRGALKSKK